MNKYTPEMQDLRRDLQQSINNFMDPHEANGVPYPLVAVDVTAVIGELLVPLFAAIGNPEVRTRFVARFIQHLPGAIERAREHIAPYVDGSQH